MMEKPVRSPMVPPIADNLSTNFVFSSFVILSKVGVSKKILTNCRFGLYGVPEMKIAHIEKYDCLKIYHHFHML